MTTTIVVTGGTGTIGRRVVPLLQQAGREIRVLTRHPGTDADGVRHLAGDVATGRGLAAALRGAEAVLHLAGGRVGDGDSTRRVAEASRAAGVGHFVLISVVGADRMPIGYFRMKAAAEAAVRGAGVPWTILRAAQLHDFAAAVLGALARSPLVPVPRAVRFEPVDGEAVAARLAQLVLAAPAGRVPDIAGPEVLGFAELAEAYLAATGRRRIRLPIPLPGAVGRAYRAGDNLAAGDALRAGGSWSAFLAAGHDG